MLTIVHQDNGRILKCVLYNEMNAISLVCFRSNLENIELLEAALQFDWFNNDFPPLMTS